MSRVTFAMAEPAFETLVASLDDRRETGFVGTLGVADDKGRDLTLCLRTLVPVPDDAYIERSGDHLLISSSGFMPTFGAAARADGAAFFIHTHPKGEARHSELDEIVDHRLSPVAQTRTGRPYYLSLVVGGSRSAPKLSGRVFLGKKAGRPIEMIRVVGDRIRVIRTADSGDYTIQGADQYDRQIRAFGVDGQSTLNALRVGIVGAGGTGSAVCEQLVRLGVGEILLVDDDVITASNVSRIYGSRMADVGKTKVSVMAKYASRIRPSSRVIPVEGRVSEEAIARKLRHCDVLFGCTDDQLGRSILARLSYWYLIPMFDMGVVITRDGDLVAEVIARVTTVGPGASCLLCRGRIQPDMIRAESLPLDERKRLAAEGYVAGLGEPDPSVGTFTTLVASFATSELLKRLFGYSHGVSAEETLIRMDRGELRKNRVSPKVGHYCADPSLWGKADDTPFLGQLWV